MRNWDHRTAFGFFAKIAIVFALTVCDNGNNGTHTHLWGNWIQTTAPTCTTAGIVTGTCTSCGEQQTQELEALGHDWEWVEVMPATLAGNPLVEQDGVETRTCSACGKNETNKISFRSYLYGMWKGNEGVDLTIDSNNIRIDLTEEHRLESSWGNYAIIESCEWTPITVEHRNGRSVDEEEAPDKNYSSNGYSISGAVIESNYLQIGYSATIGVFLHNNNKQHMCRPLGSSFEDLTNRVYNYYIKQ